MSRFFTYFLCTIFGRVPGIEPELLQPQPGVLPMSYTHPYNNVQIICLHLFRIPPVLAAAEQPKHKEDTSQSARKYFSQTGKGIDFM